MRVDAFLFNGEFEVLNLRLAELGAVVDRFVLVEANRTFRGQPKALTFAPVAGFYRRWPITYVALEDEPAGINLDGAFVREGWQRMQIARGLRDVPDTAQILIGDVDEIPRASILNDDVTMRACRQTLYYYDARTRCRSRDWLGTVVTDVGTVRRLGAERVRQLRDSVPVIADAGWHFSYTGGLPRIQAKVRAFSHSEYDTPAVHAAAADRLAAGADLFDRDDHTFERAGLADDLPQALRALPEAWPGLTEGQWKS